MAQNTMPESDRLLRPRDVTAKIRLSKSWLTKAVAADRFPRPLQVGAQAVAWRESEVDAWIAALKPVCKVRDAT